MAKIFDHHLTTTVQLPCGMPEKPVVTTNNGLFPVLAVSVQNQQNSRFNASLYRPVVVLRPGRPEVRILPVAPKETNKSKKLVCLFFIPRIIKYYVFWSDFNRKSLRFYV